MRSFSIRPYGIYDFREWSSKKELELAPKFQRRQVWSNKAKSYLIDTVLRNLPMPTIYMRHEISSKTKKIRREIVDGQQRIKTILDFLNDDFKVSKIHNETYGNLYFSQLPDDVQEEFLKYEISTTLVIGATDRLIYEIFARINTYTVKLNRQELRNSQFHGVFKQMVYDIGFEYYSYWTENKIFTPVGISRMKEAELVSELFSAMIFGIEKKNDDKLDKLYTLHDNEFSKWEEFKSKFIKIMDILNLTLGDEIVNSKFRVPAMFYSLFLVIYDLKYGLPDSKFNRIEITKNNYGKIANALNEINYILTEEQMRDSPQYIKFVRTCEKHTTGVLERKIRHDFIVNKIISSF